MKAKILLSVALATLTFFVPQDSSAATVPAGTVLIVQTTDAVSSMDPPGMRFGTLLANNVGVNGKVVLPAGTKVSGKVETSKRMMSSSQQLTVNLTGMQIGGRAIPVKTTGARPLNNDYKTRRGVRVSRADYTVPAGKLIEFKLAQPLNF